MTTTTPFESTELWAGAPLPQAPPPPNTQREAPDVPEYASREYVGYVVPPLNPLATAAAATIVNPQVAVVDAWARAGAHTAHLALSPNRYGGGGGNILTGNENEAALLTADPPAPAVAMGEDAHAMRAAAAAASAAEVDALLTRLTGAESGAAGNGWQPAHAPPAFGSESITLFSASSAASTAAAVVEPVTGGAAAWIFNGLEATLSSQTEDSPTPGASSNNATFFEPSPQQTQTQQTPLSQQPQQQEVQRAEHPAPRPPPVNYLAAALAPAQPKPRTPPPVKQEEVAPARTNKHGKPIGAFDPRKPKCALCSVNFTSEHGGKDANAGSHRHHHIYHINTQFTCGNELQKINLRVLTVKTTHAVVITHNDNYPPAPDARATLDSRERRST
jgi:hypothetical protein